MLGGSDALHGSIGAVGARQAPRCGRRFLSLRQVAGRQLPEGRQQPLGRALHEQDPAVRRVEPQRRSAHQQRLPGALEFGEALGVSAGPGVAELLERTRPTAGTTREADERAQLHERLVGLARAAPRQQRLSQPPERALGGAAPGVTGQPIDPGEHPGDVPVDDG